MEIRYTGKASVRKVGSYTWSKENNFIQDVKEVETAANLLTYPRNEFEAVGEVSKEVIKFLNNKSKKIALVQKEQNVKQEIASPTARNDIKKEIRNELRR